MKKLLTILCLLTALTCCASAEDFHIVTSFYPMYVLTLNVAHEIDGVSVENMAEQNVGCLHDYQISTRDMAAIDGADAFVINGGGMERFMEKAIGLRPDLFVVTASDGIEMIWEEEDGEYNAHVWLDPANAVIEVRNIADGLSAVDPAHAEQYAANADAYIERLTALGQELKTELEPVAGSSIITFHEAFAYFAQAFDLEIAGVIEHEPGTEPSTREIADTCDLVLNLGIKALFVEPQYPQKSAETIARETGASIRTLDPVVSGDGSPESYENLMRQNADTLLEALK